MGHVTLGLGNGLLGLALGLAVAGDLYPTEPMGSDASVSQVSPWVIPRALLSGEDTEAIPLTSGAGCKDVAGAGVWTLAGSAVDYPATRTGNVTRRSNLGAGNKGRTAP